MINYNKLKDAIANLQRNYKALKAIQAGKVSLPQGHDWEATTKTAVVQCFEVCFDTMWKHLKKHLEENCGISNEQYQEEINGKLIDWGVPGKVFDFALKNKIITKKMKENLLKYKSIRNNTSHDYSKGKAETALDVAKTFINDMLKLYKIMTVKQ